MSRSSRTGYWLLVRVSEQGPAPAVGPGRAVELDLSTISRQIRALVAAGLIARTPDPADGRASFLSLTDGGGGPGGGLRVPSPGAGPGASPSGRTTSATLWPPGSSAWASGLQSSATVMRLEPSATDAHQGHR